LGAPSLAGEALADAVVAVDVDIVGVGGGAMAGGDGTELGATGAAVAIEGCAARGAAGREPVLATSSLDLSRAAGGSVRDEPRLGGSLLIVGVATSGGGAVAVTAPDAGGSGAMTPVAGTMMLALAFVACTFPTMLPRTASATTAAPSESAAIAAMVVVRERPPRGSAAPLSFAGATPSVVEAPLNRADATTSVLARTSALTGPTIALWMPPSSASSAASAERRDMAS
jgi:hypothetical protein